MIWLGSKRGCFSDWVTQKWVQLTGQRVNLASEPWLVGPVAPTTGIGSDYFSWLASAERLRLHKTEEPAGIISDFTKLHDASFNPSGVHPNVIKFYERTSAYELDAWAEWCGIFRPFGWLLATIFSRRLQQLNVPLSALDTSKGLTSEVFQFFDYESAEPEPRYTTWFRRLRSSGNVLYAGFYSVCSLPGHSAPCVKVVFPLPNGNAVVIMRTECRSDGSFVITSAGENFGEPGFYFTVHGDSGTVWARYVRALRESIHVYPAENSMVRADHVLTYFGVTFLRLHYRMRYQAMMHDAMLEPPPTAP
jgi:hypothetical protein